MNEKFQIPNDKYSKLARNCLTLKNIFDSVFKESELTSAIYINFSMLNGNSTTLSFDKYHTLKNNIWSLA